MIPQLHSISPSELSTRLWRHATPLVIDVRREDDFNSSTQLIPGAARRPSESLANYASSLKGREIVVYCAHGRSVSQGASTALREAGIDAAYLEGGFSGWQAAKLPLVRWREPLSEQPSRWVTRERPKIDRIACPWLIRRFIDPVAEFLYVPTERVLEAAAETGATPYDIPDVEFSHVAEKCSFDALMAKFDLCAPGLDSLAEIVRGADTARLDLAPQAPGLLAISLGLSAGFPNDHDMLEQGMMVYDALYTWCRFARGEGHDWNPNQMHVRRATAA